MLVTTVVPVMKISLQPVNGLLASILTLFLRT